MIVGVIMLTLCMAATITQGQVELPFEISLMTISGTIGECPSDDNRQASHDLLRNATREIIRNAFVDPISQICGPGNWRRVFYLNASASDQSCPGQWNLVTSPVRGCAGTHSSCRFVLTDSINTTYSKVCGRIIGEGVRTTDAFYRFIANQNTIEGNYLDGVSITHGATGSRTHIWTLGTGVFKPNASFVFGHCPCDISDRELAPLPPTEVGNNYFCDRVDGDNDRLWTGESCMNDNPCCSFHNPPYFSVQLPAATTDSIELRICSDQPQNDESVLVLFAEIYVQ